MMLAYDKMYLDKARTALGRMLDFAVYDLNYKLETFWEMFLASDIASRFEYGECSVVVGKSGIELAYDVLLSSGVTVDFVTPKHTINRSKEYWTGWALAYYQWQTCQSFSAITERISISDICELYTPYHEMDIRQFCDKMRLLQYAVRLESNLKYRRKIADLSQSELATLAGIPLRTIQQYEQQQKNINKANVEYLLALSRALCCSIEDLLEPYSEPKDVFPKHESSPPLRNNAL